MGSTQIQALTDLLLEFRRERDWEKFHNPKDQALSLSLEVHELLEHMQWKNGQELQDHLKAEKQQVTDELADVLGWVLLIANDLEIDLDAAVRRKVKINCEKYPIDKAKGRATKYDKL